MKEIQRFLFSALAVIVLSSCVEEAPKPTSISRVKCEEVVDGNTESVTSNYPGRVSPQKGVNLSFRVAGVLESVVKREGDFVREGDVVAYMDERDYKLQLEATQAEWDAVNGEVKRLVAMYKEQSLSQNDYEKATSGLRQITSKLEAHRNAYEDTKLRAPFDGYVQKVNFEKGEALAAGMPVVKFISASSPEVVVNIPAAEYLRHKSLVSATVSVNSGEHRVFDIERIGVSHLSNLNQLYECRFIVKPCEGQYPPLGVSAMVTFNYGVGDVASCKVPFSAILQRDEKSYVWRVKESKAQLVEVDVIKIERDGSAIVEGDVVRGDMVISAGTSSISEGESVEIMAAPSKSNVGNIL